MSIQSRFLIWFQNQEIGQVAVKGLTNQIEVVQVDSFREFVVVFVDSCFPNTRHPVQISLSQPPFAEAS